jgi:hypothetical protein
MTALAAADTLTLISICWAATIVHWGFSETLSVSTREFLYK